MLASSQHGATLPKDVVLHGQSNLGAMFSWCAYLTHEPAWVHEKDTLTNIVLEWCFIGPYLYSMDACGWRAEGLKVSLQIA